MEIGAAFGPLQIKVWRIETMGYSAQRQNVLLYLAARETALRREGWAGRGGNGGEGSPAHYWGSGEADFEVTDKVISSGTLFSSMYR